MRTLLNQIKSEMEILTMKERVLIYVQEKQSVEDSNILVQASIAFARQEGFSIAGIVTEISYEGHMSDAAFMTVASMAEDLEVDKVLVLVPDMVHSCNMEVVLRDQVYVSWFGVPVRDRMANGMQKWKGNHYSVSSSTDCTQTTRVYYHQDF